MASVFAVHRAGAGGFEKSLALKMMHPHLADDPRFVRMFLDEARIASKVQHRNVVQVFDVGEHDGLPFLVMERLVGRTVTDLASLGSIPNAVLLDILAQAADGLHAAHETFDSDGAPLGLIHRDISPHNIFVCETGDVKVVDFGIAAARGRQAGTRTGELKGKLAYVAPEQITRAHPVSRCVDIWSLGVVAWELATGRSLFRTDEVDAAVLWNVVEAPVEDLAHAAPDLPASVQEIIHRCLQRNPSARPQTAREIAEVMHTSARALGGCPERTGAFVRERDRNDSVVGAEPVTLTMQRAEVPNRTEILLLPRSAPHTSPEPAPTAVRPTRRGILGAALTLAALTALAWFSMRSSNEQSRERAMEAIERAADVNERPVDAALSSIGSPTAWEPSRVIPSAVHAKPIASAVASAPPTVIVTASAPDTSSHVLIPVISSPSGRKPARRGSPGASGKSDGPLMRNPF